MPEWTLTPEQKQKVLEYLHNPLTASEPHTVIAKMAGVRESVVRRLRKNIADQSSIYMRGIIEEVDISKLRLDGSTQSRAETDIEVVKEYAEQIKKGAVFPPIGAVFDGFDYWVWDGYHRIPAHIKAKKKAILAEVRQGTKRDAILLSVGANTSHGLRRTHADKKRAVMRLLNDEEWHQWSNAEIARKCGVDHKTVGRHRSESDLGNSQVRKGADGRTTNTANIGRPKAPPVTEKSDPGTSTETEPVVGNGAVAVKEQPESPAEHQGDSRDTKYSFTFQEGGQSRTYESLNGEQVRAVLEDDKDRQAELGVRAPATILVIDDPISAARKLAEHFRGRRNRDFIKEFNRYSKENAYDREA